MKRIKHIFDKIATNKIQTKAIGKKLLISIANQMVSSGTNFAMGIYLVRLLTTADFGLYGIGFSITLLYAGVGDALFLTQMVVHVPDKAQEDRLPYAARILAALVIFCAFTFAASKLLLVIGGAWSQLVNQYASLVSAIVAASIAYIIKDFFIRHSYTARKETWALGVNVAVATSLMTMLLAQFRLGSTVNAEIALWIYASSNMVGALVGFALVRLPILAVRLQELTEDVREILVGGRWALGGVAVTWLQTQAYMYVAALFVGPTGVGLANAARILITPALFLMPAITQLAMPRLATLRSTNLAQMLKISMMLSIILVFFAVLYSVTLIGFGDILAYLLIGKYHYEEISPLVAAWCLLLIFQFSRFGTVVCLQVTKGFRLLMLLNTVSLIAAIVIAVILMNVIGVQGAVLGSAAGELIFSVLLYIAIKEKFQQIESKHYPT